MKYKNIQPLSRALLMVGAMFACMAPGSAAQAADCVAAPARVADYMAARAANHCPRAHAGADSLVTIDQPAPLSAAASSDADGERLSFHWRLVSAPTGSGAQPADPHALRTQFTPDLAGDYVFELAVTDAAGATSVDSVHMSTTDTAPVAVAGADMTATPGAYVVLNGLDSIDFEGAALRYRWELLSRPEASGALIDNANSANASIYLDAAGDYVAQLIVSDGKFDSIADTIRISTNNSAPVANAGRVRTLAPNSTLILDGAKSLDADGDALAYHWSLLSAPAAARTALAKTDTAVSSLRLHDEGLYLFQLIVDDGVYRSAPDTVLVEVVTRRMENVDPKDFLHLTTRAGGDDTDGDGVTDTLDNCVLVANPNQRDTDGDGLGNFCDADLNQDGTVNAVDLGIFRTRFFTTDPDADFNGDGIVNALDLGLLRLRFFLPPGPAGTTIWVSLVDGDWADRLNWQPQVVPSAGTLALIDVGPSVTVTSISDTIMIKDLTNNENLVLSSSSFESTGVVENGGTISATASTINNTQFIPSMAGAGTMTVNAGTHTWSNVVLGVDTTLNNGALVNMSNGLGIDAITLIDAPSSPTGFQFNTQSLSGVGTIILDGAGNSQISEPRLFPFNSTTLTIDDGLTIRGGKGTIGQPFGNIVMNASVIADVSGEAILLIGSTWSAQGSVSATNGGEIQLSGNLDNGGGLLTVDGAGGVVRMLAGTALRNANINATAGTNIQVNAGTTTMQNLLLNSDITHSNGALTNVTDGLILNGTAQINAPTSPTGYQFINTQSVTGSGTFVLNGVGNSQITEPRLFPSNSTTLTIGSGITVRGGKGTVGQSFANLEFLGELIADVAGEELAIGGATWSANNTLQAINDGEIRMFGSFNNGTNALAIDGADGVVAMTAAAALRNATIIATAGTTLNFPSGTTTLEAMTMTIDTFHANGALTNVTDGLTLNGAAYVDGPSSPTGFQFLNTQTLDGVATFTLDGTGNSVLTETRLLQSNATTLTIGSSITVQGGNATIGNAFASLVFNGVLDANVSGQRMDVGGSSWSANQTLRSQNGGTLEFYGAHENSGASVALDAATGNVQMRSGATLRDTVINGTPGTNLVFQAGTTTMDNVTLTADTTHENGALTNVTDGLTINGTATIVAPTSPTGLQFLNSQSLLGNLTVVFDSAGNSVASEPRLFNANSTTLTIGSSVAIQGATGTIGNLFATLVLDGSVDASVAGENILITGSPWRGTGSVAAHNGGIVEFSGTLDNAGQTISMDTGGGSAVLLAGAAWRNATIAGSAGTDITISAGTTTFQNLVFNGDMNYVNGALTNVSDGLTLNGTATINAPTSPTGMQFTNTQTLGGTGTVVINGVGNSVITEPRLLPSNSTVLTIGPGITVSGGQGTIGQPFATVALQGTVSANLGTLNVPGTVNHTGTLEALAGNTVSVLNTLTVGTGAQFHAAPGSTVNAAGTLTLLANSVVNLDVDALGAAGTGTLTAGTLNFAGTLNVSAVNGFAPNIGDMFNLTTSGANSGTFATVNSIGLGGGQSFVVTYPVGDAVATVN